MILDLTAHFPENYDYKDPTQREAWGSFEKYRILPNYSQESSWRTIFRKRKMEN